VPLLIATTGASTEVQGDPSPVDSSSNSSTPPPQKPSGYPILLAQTSGQNLSSFSPQRGSNIIMTSTPDLTGVSCGGSISSIGNGGSPGPIQMEPHNNNTQSIADYLAQLLKDKKQLAAFPNVFLHVERLLDDEIGKVRGNLFQINGKKNEPLVLPDASGASITLSEKVYVPIKEFPDFNFVGRILGPRGMTTKQLEQETGCKIMVRGKGSMRDKKKEDQNRGKPNWEHLNDELHVLITVEDSENRAQMKLQRAIDEVKKLLTVSEGEDELKKRQLMELAIINGTYRDSQSKHSSPGLDTNQQRFLANSQNAALQNMLNQQNALRTAAAQGLGGAPLILSQHARLQMPASVTTTLAGTQNAAHLTHAGLINGSLGQQPPPLINPNDTSGLLYAQYASALQNADYAAAADNYGLMSPLLAAQYAADPTGGTGAGGKDRRHALNGSQTVRAHPYTRN